MIAIALLALAAGTQPAVTAESRPARPFAEISGSGTHIDGDILVRNSGAEPLELVEIAVDIFDRNGRLVQRKELNGNGISPSIQLVTERSLPAKGALLVYNPLGSFAPDIEAARLDYRLAFATADGKGHATAKVSVSPRPEPKGRVTFPTVGTVLIWDGHDFASHHRRWNFVHPMLHQAGFDSNAMRYSLDIIQVDADGRRSSGDEDRNENWLAFGKPVRSVAEGTIVAVKADQPDDRKFDIATASIPNALYGNYVVIAHADGSHSMYGHLKQNSLTVKVGDRVGPGQKIAAIGASGSALFPHLHFQRMDGPNDRSEGVPTRFEGITRPGGTAPLNGFIDSGDVLVAR